MPALEAARFGDEIGHTKALAGLLIGAVAAAAVAVAIVGTGGMAALRWVRGLQRPLPAAGWAALTWVS
jgi:hypothetical protein